MVEFSSFSDYLDLTPRTCFRLADVHGRTLATFLLALGAVLLLFGAMLFLNVLSLRDLALDTHVDPAIAAVFATRDEMSHRRAQSLELLTGVVGVATLLLAAAWLRTSRRQS